MARPLLVAAAVAVFALCASRPVAAQPTTWNFTQANIPSAQPLGNYGHGVLVAVVDTWVDPKQPQFAGRLFDEADCTSGSCHDHAYAPDSCVHGTHVAGTIASSNYGVAPEADILAVQVLSGPAGSPDPNASCSGSADAVAAGIDFAVAKGAKVINMSLGDEVPGLFQSSAITNAVKAAAAHGVAVIIAAGNSGVPLTDSYGNAALVVAATGPTGQLATYSDYNSPLTGDVSVAAPGGDTGQDSSCAASTCILSTFPGNALGLLEGTSMAAPHVSGLAVLLLAQNPYRGLSDVYSTIERTATPLSGAGAGLIDAARALALRPAAAPRGTPQRPPVSSGAGTSGGTAASTSAHSAGGGTASPGESAAASSAGTPTSAPVATARPPAAAAGTTTTAPSASHPASPPGPGAPLASGWTHPVGHRDSWAARNAGLLSLACVLLAAVTGTAVWAQLRQVRARP